MLVEPDGFIVVAVEQTLAVKPGLVDQTRQILPPSFSTFAAAVSTDGTAT